ncbi:hypothetical protein [Streptomyces sp. NPDC047108]|uniref:hypothetical protein n=1 Tax=Streptomyces sp. NPDC047108 TaxID=3155025 RepID=UPI003401440C
MTTDDTGPEAAPYTPRQRGRHLASWTALAVLCVLPRTRGKSRLRIASGTGLALLPVLFVVIFIMAIDDALGGRSTVLYDISIWMLLGSGVLGLAVLLLPARVVDRPARKALLVGQCALLPVAVALAVAA